MIWRYEFKISIIGSGFGEEVHKNELHSSYNKDPKSIMIWVYFPEKAVCSTKYTDIFLQPKYRPSIREFSLGNAFFFFFFYRPDWAFRQSAWIWEQWLTHNFIMMMRGLGNIPELNHLEHFWNNSYKCDLDPIKENWGNNCLIIQNSKVRKISKHWLAQYTSLFFCFEECMMPMEILKGQWYREYTWIFLLSIVFITYLFCNANI